MLGISIGFNFVLNWNKTVLSGGSPYVMADL